MSSDTHRVLIPTTLRSYTAQKEWVQARGATLAALLLDLEVQFPGLRFRMVDEQDQLRPHMRVFVEARAVMKLSQALQPGVDVAIVQALSGG